MAGPADTMCAAADERHRPDLSIVVAARAREGDLGACMEALRPQISSGVEVILVTDAPPDTAGWQKAHMAHGLVPELWAFGIRRARGRIVSLLSGSVVPAPDWVARTLAAHDGRAAAIGGPVEPVDALGFVARAVYLCRYSSFMLPVDGAPTSRIPGDNASYDGSVLEAYADRYQEGFWEPQVHAAMLADGRTMGFDPRRVVRHSAGTGILAFSQQRFAHGRANGRVTAAGMGMVEIAVRTLTQPVVPALMLLRVARDVWRRHRYVGWLVATAPLITWFYCCWAAGELTGRLQTLRTHRPR